ncbi:helix-turn-helix domain-containing protein [Tumebacillus permanentifrigoris]|uniref:DNA-binding XRE family transcriptional regulator n=1 Tax=Tumebacillus permanentifrigoris TaxID=378543 RepID=A0A316D748_9BACL|nr:helix-turn-helix transcriptional regulator [Tumebacillus permanentifrigoris]PWK11477.1 DNA-binding XRE family transcriptional regulator [Tumebacillus permanentifrigoris]
MAELGTLIRQARKEMGLTAVQLAEAVGVTPTYIGELERGVKKNPSMQVIAGMAERLDKPVNYFFGASQESRIIRSLPQDVSGYVRETILEPYCATRDRVETLSDADVMEALVDYLRTLKRRTESEEK